MPFMPLGVAWDRQRGGRTDSNFKKSFPTAMFPFSSLFSIVLPLLSGMFFFILGPATTICYTKKKSLSFRSFSKDISAPKRRKITDPRLFYSQRFSRPPIRWCDWQGSPSTMVGPRPPPIMVSNCQVLASPRDVIFRHPSHFVPGELHNHFQEWRRIIPNGEGDEVLSFIKNRVHSAL